jgi:hypothetical protein
VTLDDRRSTIQGLTIGDGWLLARNRDAETWIDLAERRNQWTECGEGVRFRLADERTMIVEQGTDAYWLSLNGAGVTIAAPGVAAQRRGWRNLQLRAAERPQSTPLDVPYLIPTGPGEDDADDIVFLGPVYFSETMRIADLAQSARLAAMESLPLLAGGFAAAATLSETRLFRIRDDELRAAALSTALSDAAAVSAVVNSLLLLEVYAERLGKKSVRRITARARGATSRPA